MKKGGNGRERENVRRYKFMRDRSIEVMIERETKKEEKAWFRMR